MFTRNKFVVFDNFAEEVKSSKDRAIGALFSYIVGKEENDEYRALCIYKENKFF